LAFIVNVSYGTNVSRFKTQKLSFTLPGILKDKGWERKFDQHRVFLEWDNLVDETIAAHSRPLKVVKDVLWLEVENSAWMQQLQYQKIILLETLNAYLDISRFSDIRFALQEKKKKKRRRQESSLSYISPPPEEVAQFEKQISFLEDGDIRDSLMRLWYLSKACKSG
jgi:hypothetical protein